MINMEHVREGHMNNILEGDGDPLCVDMSRIGRTTSFFNAQILKECGDNIRWVLPDIEESVCSFEFLGWACFEIILCDLGVMVCPVGKYLRSPIALISFPLVPLEIAFGCSWSHPTIFKYKDIKPDINFYSPNICQPVKFHDLIASWIRFCLRWFVYCDWHMIILLSWQLPRPNCIPCRHF